MPDCDFCGSKHAPAYPIDKEWAMLCNECRPDALAVFEKEPEFSTFRISDIQDALEYLDELRESGRTNMLGATEYLQKEWMDDFMGDIPDPLPDEQATRILQFWMHSLSRRTCAREAGA